MSPVIINEGSSPIILAFPHGGTEVPANIWENLNENGRKLADTDWHIHRLYDGLLGAATTVQATFHRYVVDANRDPAGGSLYPGQNTTGLCPETDFDGLPIWKDGFKIDQSEIEKRKDQFHSPYHRALSRQIERVKNQHGIAVLYDCHSIRSKIPYLFDDVLPDFNMGTNSGTSCDPKFEQSVVENCQAAEEYSSVLNGRFKGGWTTRHYANPAQNIHAVQMELALSAYASETHPWAYDIELAEKLRKHLKVILSQLEDLAINN
ncbi:MAG: N-formylglutamate deformylase [Sneathiella sp.]|nr:N-formylglutamate deformylase [Sneathiella sp.]